MCNHKLSNNWTTADNDRSWKETYAVHASLWSSPQLREAHPNSRYISIPRATETADCTRDLDLSHRVCPSDLLAFRLPAAQVIRAD
jgi:hypothetical protein